jgi:glycosyl transferase family 25
LNTIDIESALRSSVAEAGLRKWRAVVINLADDRERRQWMCHQLDRARIGFTILQAETGPEARRRFPAKLEELPLTAGEIGCWGSHLKIAERVVSGVLPEPVLVLEDDVGLPEDLTDTVDRLLETLPHDWDIVHLSGFPKRGYSLVTPLGGDRAVVSYGRVPHGTGAYLLRRKGAEKMLRMEPGIFAIDQSLARYARFGLTTYGVFPPPIQRDCLPSRIDAIDGGRRYRLKSFGWKIRNLMQKLADRLNPPDLHD